VHTEQDAHAAREHLSIGAFVFDRLTQQLPPEGHNGSILALSVLHIGFLGPRGVRLHKLSNKNRAAPLEENPARGE